MKPATSIAMETPVNLPETVRFGSGYNPSWGAEIELMLRCARTFPDADTRDEIDALIHRGIDWDCLLRLASDHGVVALLSQTLNANYASDVPSDILERLRVQSRANAQRNLNMARSLLEIVDLLRLQSVPIVPYKGPLLAATAYGNLSLREFCDLDILVREHDVLKAMAVLTENGYTLKLPPDESRPMSKLIGSKKDFRFVSDDGRVVVELHWRLAGRHFCFPYRLDQLWKRLEQISFSGTPLLNIPPEDLLVILCAHGSKHLWGRLLWICDIAELLKSHPNIDWQRTMRNARKSGSQRMVLLGLHLANTLLGSRLPGEVLRATNTNGTIEPLAQSLLSMAFASPNGQLEHPSPVLYPHFIRMRERLRDKARLGFQYFKATLSAAVTPNADDREFFALPASVAFLYYVLRPFRLIGRSALSHRITHRIDSLAPHPSEEMQRTLVSIIATLPFKPYLFRAMRPLHPPKRVYQYLTYKGPFNVRIDDRHSFVMQHHGYGVETELFWKGLSNGNHNHAIRLWIKLCADASTIVDIGANLGLFSLIAKTVNPKARVFGFEPVSHLEEKFKANCDLNGFDIKCQRLALSNTDGKQEIFIAPGNIMTASLRSNPSRTEKEHTETSRLATFIERHKIRRIDLMKIDVESSEPQVLEGMGPYLQTMRPTTIIEILTDDIGSRVESLIAGCPYLFFCLNEHGGAIRQDHLTVQGRSRHSRNFLLCDKDTAVALNLL